ncbi:MAG: hypothetical protein LBQ08_01455 [Holosporaceae bacterium]|nr:hypothetical protein [Holosporaceae bacterium]
MIPPGNVTVSNWIEAREQRLAALGRFVGNVMAGDIINGLTNTNVDTLPQLIRQGRPLLGEADNFIQLHGLNLTQTGATAVTPRSPTLPVAANSQQRPAVPASVQQQPSASELMIRKAIEASRGGASFNSILRYLGAQKMDFVPGIGGTFPAVGMFHPYNYSTISADSNSPHKTIIAYELNNADLVSLISARILKGNRTFSSQSLTKILISAQFYDKGYVINKDDTICDTVPQPLLFRPHRIFARPNIETKGCVNIWVRSGSLDTNGVLGDNNCDFSVHYVTDKETNTKYLTLSPNNMDVSRICPNDRQWRLMIYVAQQVGGPLAAGLTIMCPFFSHDCPGADLEYLYPPQNIMNEVTQILLGSES